MSAHKVFRTKLQSQTELENTHQQKTETNRIKAKEINWLTRRKSNLSIENELPVYKAVIKPTWTYGIELWGCATKSNTALMQ
jgi:hypothetical protein